MGLALVVVPLQVGSATVAFPRAAAASFWGWLVGSGLVLASYAGNSYTRNWVVDEKQHPTTGTPYSPASAP